MKRLPTTLARLLVLVLVLQACAGRQRPIVDPTLAAKPARTTLVFVPGITGTVLRDPASGQVVWGSGPRLISPRDGGYAIARPIAGGSDSRLAAAELIEEIRLWGIRKPIYGPVFALLEANGYRRGELSEPRAGDTLLPFPYDWRLDNVNNARLLYARLEALRRARGLERLEIDLLCQSNGAHICRYLAKYGDAPLEDAAAGRAEPPATLTVRKMILIGTANGGSLRILRELDRGRKYVPFFGRLLRPEVLFTLPSLYQELPAYRDAGADSYFVDAEGKVLELDLYDAETWRRHGFSVFAPAVARRLARGPYDGLFGDQAARLRFLERMLTRARALQRALVRDVAGFGATRYYLVQNDAMPTPDRALLTRRGGRWRLRFTGDRALRRLSALEAKTSADGDGHATVASQTWLAPQERAAIVGDIAYVDGPHFEMILRPETHRRLLAFLLDDR